MFRDTLQVSFIGIGNNLNQTGFSTQELVDEAGFNRSGADQLYDGSLAIGGNNNGGIQRVAAGGLNINTDYGAKLKINLLYFYSYTTDVANYNTFNQQFLHDTTLSSNGTGYTHSTNIKHTIGGLVEWNPDTTTKIRYTPGLTFSSSTTNRLNSSFAYNNFVPQLSSNSYSDTGHNSSMQFQQSFSYYHKLKRKNASVTITHNLNISPGSGFNFTNQSLTSYTAALSSQNLHWLIDNSNSSANAGLGIAYRFPLAKKMIGSVGVNGNYWYSKGDRFTYNQNRQTGQYDMYIDSLSRNLQRYQYTETLRPEVSYDFSADDKLTINAGLQWSQTLNLFGKNLADVNRYELFILPSVKFNTKHFYFNYDESVSQPAISDMVPLTTFFTQLYSRVGNPNLKPSRLRSISGGYYANKTETMFNVNVYGGLSMEQNNNFSETTVNSVGATIATPINKSGVYSISAGADMGKGLKKINNWQIRFNTRINGSYRHDFFEVNNVEGFQNTTNINFNGQVFVDWNNKFQINPSYNLSPSITSYQNVGYSTLKYVGQNLDVPIVIRPAKHTSIETNYKYTYNPLAGAGYQTSSNLFNFAVARQFQKADRGEIRLSCYDLFNQNVFSYRYTDGNQVTDVQSQTLKRYFLVTYTYRFSRTVIKK